MALFKTATWADSSQAWKHCLR